MSEKLESCCCSSDNIKELKPYGIESVQCGDCHVSLRKQDWNRVMGSNVPEGYKLIRVINTGKFVLEEPDCRPIYERSLTKEESCALDTALKASSKLVSRPIPEGYQLVPIEPGDWLFDRTPSEGKRLAIYRQYKAMLKAAKGE